MSIEMPDFDVNVLEAVRAFWGNREAARQKQVESGRADQGERSSVTAGKNMDGFLAIVRQLVAALEFKEPGRSVLWQQFQ